MEMKARLDVKDNRPLADFLPTLTIAAKKLAAQAGKLPEVMPNGDAEDGLQEGALSTIWIPHMSVGFLFF